MTLLSYISIPVETSNGLQFVRFDLIENVIRMKDGSVLVNMQEVAEDIGVLENTSENEEEEAALSEEDQVWKILKECDEGGLDLNVLKNLLSTMASKSKQNTPHDPSCECCH